MGIHIAITGASGHMGKAVMQELRKLEEIESIKILLLDSADQRRFGRKFKRMFGKKLSVIYGDIVDYDDCAELVNGSDYVIHMAAIIPPAADKYADRCYDVNYLGTVNIVDAVNAQARQPKLIHCSTVAVYGHRNYMHPWGRVGDPLLVSPFDNYAAAKLKAERYLLDSCVKRWAVLRQTGILYKDLLMSNIGDGLMFHTCLNVPLEWVSDRDSGVLIRNILIKDMAGSADDFWMKVYNIGGGDGNRNTGYETFDSCFKEFGINTKKVMKPIWHSIRNFHGIWFEDSDELEEMFHFRSDTVEGFWRRAINPLYKLARLVPPSVISKLVIQRLLDDYNSPLKWIRDGERGKVKAYFGSGKNVDCMPMNWEEFPLLAEGRVVAGDVDYEAMRDVSNVCRFGYRLDHGYDESKPDCELDIDDMRKAAVFRGGKCLSESMKKGDLYTKLKWQCHDGHIFEATPYAVIKAGHWCPVCCQPGEWDFDRQAAFSPFFAQVWYDTHAKGERYVYYYDADGVATFRRETEDRAA